jgi:hypothetical protein
MKIIELPKAETNGSDLFGVRDGSLYSGNRTIEGVEINSVRSGSLIDSNKVCSIVHTTQNDLAKIKVFIEGDGPLIVDPSITDAYRYAHFYHKCSNGMQPESFTSTKGITAGETFKCHNSSYLESDVRTYRPSVLNDLSASFSDEVDLESDSYTKFSNIVEESDEFFYVMVYGMNFGNKSGNANGNVFSVLEKSTGKSTVIYRGAMDIRRVGLHPDGTTVLHLIGADAMYQHTGIFDFTPSLTGTQFTTLLKLTPKNLLEEIPGTLVEVAGTRVDYNNYTVAMDAIRPALKISTNQSGILERITYYVSSVPKPPNTAGWVIENTVTAMTVQFGELNDNVITQDLNDPFKGIVYDGGANGPVFVRSGIFTENRLILFSMYGERGLSSTTPPYFYWHEYTVNFDGTVNPEPIVTKKFDSPNPERNNFDQYPFYVLVDDANEAFWLLSRFLVTPSTGRGTVFHVTSAGVDVKDVTVSNGDRNTNFHCARLHEGRLLLTTTSVYTSSMNRFILYPRTTTSIDVQLAFNKKSVTIGEVIELSIDSSLDATITVEVQGCSFADGSKVKIFTVVADTPLTASVTVSGQPYANVTNVVRSSQQ